MWRCECQREKVKMWRWADVKMSRCEDEKMWRWADVKMSRCEDEQMWRWEGVKMRRCEDEKMWRWEGVREGVKMRRCEDEKMRYRPPLLEEPSAQTLSGKKTQPWAGKSFRNFFPVVILAMITATMSVKESTPRDKTNINTSVGATSIALFAGSSSTAHMSYGFGNYRYIPPEKDPYVHLVISPGLLSKGPCGPELNRPCTRARCVVAGPSGVTGGIAQSSEHQCRKASWKVVSGVPPKRLSAGWSRQQPLDATRSKRWMQFDFNPV